MRKIIIAAAIIGAVSLSACTPEQVNTAKAAAAASIDAACTNVPNMDSQWQALAPRANSASQLAYASAKASLVAICDNRPLSSPDKQVAAATAAVVQIAGLIARYAVNQSGG